MSKSKFILLLAILSLMAMPVAVYAQTPTESTAAGLLDGAGTAVVSDDAALSDSVTVVMTGVTQPSDGTAYEGWLVSDDGSARLSVGVMSITSDGSISHTFDSSSEGYAGEDLIANYSLFEVTVEAVPDLEPASPGVTVYFDSIPSDGMTHIRHLTSNWPEGSSVGILTNLKAQLDIAISHAELAQNSETIEDVHSHMQHVVNVIEGEVGANFNTSTSNPGDGIGIIAHAEDTKHATLAADAVADDAVIGSHASLVIEAGTNIQNWVVKARDSALSAIGTSNLALAKIYVGPGGGTVISGLQAARSGFDVNVDGTIGSGLSEGGAVHAYNEAQLMATYSLVAGSPEPLVTPTPIPVPTATPVPTPTPAPTATPEPPTPTPSPLQPTAPGLPGVGDDAVPMVAQLGLLLAVVLLGAGGLFAMKGRRSRKNI